MPDFTEFSDIVSTGTTKNFAQCELETLPKEYSGRIALYKAYPKLTVPSPHNKSSSEAPQIFISHKSFNASMNTKLNKCL
jgi:hypothetical protein